MPAPPAPERTAVDAVRARLYPESAAGGFTRIDGTVQFYTRVNALLEPEDVVLDLGAGRGKAHRDDPVACRRALMDLRGRCARVIGADVDPAVRDNPSLHEARLIETDGPRAFLLPLDDASVDLILCDHVLEHVAEPAAFAAEAARVLRPGGWFCARTPNRWGYIALASRMIPEGLHGRVLSRAQPGRKEEDVFPTCHLMNDRAQLRRAFPPAAWDHHVHMWDAEPAYFGASAPLWRLARAVSALLPEGMGATLMACLRKRP